MAREERKARHAQEKGTSNDPTQRQEQLDELELEVTAGASNSNSNQMGSALYMTMTSAVAEVAVSKEGSNDSKRSSDYNGTGCIPKSCTIGLSHGNSINNFYSLFNYVFFDTNFFVYGIIIHFILKLICELLFFCRKN